MFPLGSPILAKPILGSGTTPVSNGGSLSGSGALAQAPGVIVGMEDGSPVYAAHACQVSQSGSCSAQQPARGGAECGCPYAPFGAPYTLAFTCRTTDADCNRCSSFDGDFVLAYDHFDAVEQACVYKVLVEKETCIEETYEWKFFIKEDEVVLTCFGVEPNISWRAKKHFYSQFYLFLDNDTATQTACVFPSIMVIEALTVPSSACTPVGIKVQAMLIGLDGDLPLFAGGTCKSKPSTSLSGAKNGIPIQTQHLGFLIGMDEDKPLYAVHCCEGNIADRISGSSSGSLSDSKSASVSTSQSGSDSFSNSESNSRSDSGSVSESDSKSTSVSGSPSDSVSVSVSDTVSDSQSVSGASESLSGSGGSTKTSESASDSKTASDSASGSDSTSDSNSQSTSDSLRTSDSLSASDRLSVSGISYQISNLVSVSGSDSQSTSLSPSDSVSRDSLSISFAPGTIETLCCPSALVSETVYVEFLGGLASLGTVTLIYDGTSWVGYSSGCDYPVDIVLGCSAGIPFGWFLTVTQSGGGTTNTKFMTIVSCSPLHLTGFFEGFPGCIDSGDFLVLG